MKPHRLLLMGVMAVLGFASCATLDRGKYVLNINSVNETKIEINGSLYLSAFVSWRDTQYGEPPIPLIENVIRSEFGKLGCLDIKIQNVRWTRYENSNTIGYAAIVVMNRGAAPPAPQKIRGEFPIEQRAKQ
jgi:hypothetical protein